MFIRWQNSKTVSRQKQNDKVNRCRAILVESARIDGKPRQQHVAFLASYRPDWLPAARFRFWREASERLDRLGNRISLEDRHKIEAALVARVPRPSPEEQRQHDRETQQWLQGLRALVGSRRRRVRRVRHLHCDDAADKT
jgi:hypothetical protein